MKVNSKFFKLLENVNPYSQYDMANSPNNGNDGSLNEFLRILSNGGTDVNLNIVNRETAQYKSGILYFLTIFLFTRNASDKGLLLLC